MKEKESVSLSGLSCRMCKGFADYLDDNIDAGRAGGLVPGEVVDVAHCWQVHKTA